LAKGPDPLCNRDKQEIAIATRQNLLKSEINNQAEFIKDQFGVITAKPRSPDIVSEDDDAPEPPQDIHSSQFDFFFKFYLFS